MAASWVGSVGLVVAVVAPDSPSSDDCELSLVTEMESVDSFLGVVSVKVGFTRSSVVFEGASAASTSFIKGLSFEEVPDPSDSLRSDGFSFGSGVVAFIVSLSML